MPLRRAAEPQRSQASIGHTPSPAPALRVRLLQTFRREHDRFWILTAHPEVNLLAAGHDRWVGRLGWAGGREGRQGDAQRVFGAARRWRAGCRHPWSRPLPSVHTCTTLHPPPTPHPQRHDCVQAGARAARVCHPRHPAVLHQGAVHPRLRLRLPARQPPGGHTPQPIGSIQPGWVWVWVGVGGWVGAWRADSRCDWLITVAMAGEQRSGAELPRPFPSAPLPSQHCPAPAPPAAPCTVPAPWTMPPLTPPCTLNLNPPCRPPRPGLQPRRELGAGADRRGGRLIRALRCAQGRGGAGGGAGERRAGRGVRAGGGGQPAPAQSTPWAVGCVFSTSGAGCPAPARPPGCTHAVVLSPGRACSPPCQPWLIACPQEAKRGFSAAAVFIARNRFALLDKSSNQIIIKDLANEVRRGQPAGQGEGSGGGAGSHLHTLTPAAPAVFLALPAHPWPVRAKPAWLGPALGHSAAHCRRSAPSPATPPPVLPQVTKKVTSPLPTTDNIFYAGTGMLLCRSEEKVGGGGGWVVVGDRQRWGLWPWPVPAPLDFACSLLADLLPPSLARLPSRLPPSPQVALFDVQQRSTVAELSTPPIKYAVWSGDMNRVALLRWGGPPGRCGSVCVGGVWGWRVRRRCGWCGRGVCRLCGGRTWGVCAPDTCTI